MSTKTPVNAQALLISGAQLVCPASKFERSGDLLIEEGKITALGKPGELNGRAKSLRAEVFDAKGLVCAPGFIDLHATIPDPGQEHVEDFDSGSASAAAGGFTSVCVKPHSNPVNDNAFMTDFILRRAKEKSRVRILPVGALSAAREGKRLAEIGSMVSAGVRAVGDASSLGDSYFMRKALEYTRAFHIPVFTHAEDKSLVGQGVMNEGLNSNRLGLRGIPSAAEEIIVARDSILARHAKSRLHFHSLSTAGALDMLRRAKDQGIAVSGETNPQYFTLTSDVIASYDANYKCFPPLRTEEDVEAVVAALADGTLDVVASAHAPQSRSTKELAFEHASAGMIGLETCFPLLMELVNEKRISLMRAIELLSLAPAKILGLSADCGQLKKGSQADLVLFRLKDPYTYSEAEIRSAAKNTPFLGRKFSTRIYATFVNGTQVFSNKRGGRA